MEFAIVAKEVNLMPHHRKAIGHGSENKVPAIETSLFSMRTHVSSMSADCNRKASAERTLYMRPI